MSNLYMTVGNCSGGCQLFGAAGKAAWRRRHYRGLGQWESEPERQALMASGPTIPVGGELVRGLDGEDSVDLQGPVPKVWGKQE